MSTILRSRTFLRLGLLSLGMGIFPHHTFALEKHFYRYRDDNQQLVISDHLSATAIQHGYDLLDEHLQVLNTVAPPPSAEKLHQIKTIQATHKQEEQLKKLYSSAQDAQRQCNEQLTVLQTSIDLLMSNQSRLQSQRVEDASHAANLERSGHTPPADLLQKIRTEDDAINQLQHQQGDLQKRQQAVRQQFDSIIQRLKALEHQDNTKDATSLPASDSSE